MFCGQLKTAGDAAVALAILALLSAAAGAQSDPPRPPSLKTVAVNEPANLGDFVIDRAAAIVLGKALFWDMQVGSDGVQACATCHFNAGADSRSINVLNPGSQRIHVDGSADPDTEFAEPLRPNRQLSAADFPLSPTSNEVVSSPGVLFQEFAQLSRRRERTVLIADPDGFQVAGVNIRRVEPRNTPSVINAVFNYRNFWDGRAENVFNGGNNLGDKDPNVRVFRADDPDRPQAVQVRLENSSLASQAMAPPLSSTEMSARGRTFLDLGAKLLPQRGLGRSAVALRPLGRQRVHPEDSVLGPLSRYPSRGLQVRTYRELVERAFHPSWWSSPKLIRVAADSTATVVDRVDPQSSDDFYTLAQYNFSLIFGIAIQMYEATLVADDSPYDRFMDGDEGAISPLAIQGVDLFRSQTRGRCINCHEGAELTGASVRRVSESPLRIRENQALDRGFNNIGILPTPEDAGVGGDDPLGNPLSTVRRMQPLPIQPIAVDGAFKVPGLRNVELTAPYFHNGGYLSLSAVVDFYSRGGDVRPQHSLDGSFEIAPLNILDNTAEEKQALEAFLLSLTDERVRDQRAPFDHPELLVPNGHLGDETRVAADHSGRARDRMLRIRAVGRNGAAPLARFLSDP